MKKNFKRLCSCFIAILLSTIFIIPQNIGVFASSDEWGKLQPVLEFVSSINDDIDFLIPEYIDEYEAMRSVIKSLTPEAMEIFALFLATNEQALQTHQIHVDSNFQIEENLIAGFSAVTPANQQVLHVLNTGLIGLGLSQAMVNMFVGVGSAILANPVITTAVILAALTTVAVYQVIVGNWGSMSGLWTSIRSVFSDAFAPVVATTVVVTGFNNANTRFTTSFNNAVRADLGSIASRHRIGQCDRAADEMERYLRARNARGERLRLLFPANTISHIWSISTNQAVGNNFVHHGIGFNGRAFCVVHPAGTMPIATWTNDFIVDILLPNNMVQINVRGILSRTPF
ncbi:MAG: hypothetical protein FWB91_06510 [Defluviitaleaceae bacterium]|nr:hypothetical protein [Defluviitaleaceae bacterium]